ncbi:hypothetical protein E3T55_09950 [Cryobacterium frigoriphilum]|uniref:Uncharacterized protein n=1 Tax=Cryobacterium frigoriphilum TaxID=1259150 RepID=A0A4R9A1D1_9MICO|nr:hypothetical protein [Cryobacterium frigoriphilum]TFD50219.1 hypothetical protein E3T55_09950 [Cryobacterium frigoriphilum]
MTMESDLATVASIAESAASFAVSAFTASAAASPLVGRLDLAISQREAAAAAATFRAELSGFSEQRHENYRLWVQSVDGQRYGDWAPGATLLAEAIGARDAAVLAAWQVDAARVITPDERSAFASGYHLPPSPRNERSAVLHTGSVAVLIFSPIVWALTLLLFFLTGTSLNPVAHLGGLGLLIGGTLWFTARRLADPEWHTRNEAAGLAAADRRVELLGFDPLADPTRLPRPWAEDTFVKKRLEQFLTDAYTNFPIPGELLALHLPRTRNPAVERSAQLRALLTRFEATDATSRLLATHSRSALASPADERPVPNTP